MTRIGDYKVSKFVICKFPVARNRRVIASLSAGVISVLTD